MEAIDACPAGGALRGARHGVACGGVGGDTRWRLASQGKDVVAYARRRLAGCLRAARKRDQQGQSSATAGAAAAFAPRLAEFAAASGSGRVKGRWRMVGRYDVHA